MSDETCKKTRVDGIARCSCSSSLYASLVPGKTAVESSQELYISVLILGCIAAAISSGAIRNRPITHKPPGKHRVTCRQQRQILDICSLSQLTCLACSVTHDSSTVSAISCAVTFCHFSAVLFFPFDFFLAENQPSHQVINML